MGTQHAMLETGSDFSEAVLVVLAVPPLLLEGTLHTMIIWGIECQPLRHVQHDTAYVQTCVDLVLCSPLCGIFVFSHLKALKRAHRLCRSGAGSVHRGGNI